MSHNNLAQWFILSSEFVAAFSREPDTAVLICCYRLTLTESNTMTEPEIIQRAIDILKSRLTKPEACFTASGDVRNYLTLKFAELEHEAFSVMFLNSQHGLIKLEEMFRGTINASAVYPREVLKASMKFNAAAVILTHNHPSGVCEPSSADRNITQQIIQLLSMADVRVLDHIIVGGESTFSFAENGYL